MTKKQIQIISDNSSEKLHKRVGDFCKEKGIKILKIEYQTILGGKEHYAYIYYNEE